MHGRFLFGVLTNAAFAAPATVAAYYGYTIIATMALLVTIVSSAYHLCVDLDHCLIRSGATWQALDHVTSNICVLAIVARAQLHLLRRTVSPSLLSSSSRWSHDAYLLPLFLIKSGMCVATVTAILLSVLFYDGFVDVIVLLILYVLSTVAIVSLRCYRRLSLTDIFLWQPLVVSILVAALCAASYTAPGGFDIYLHAAWHVIASVAASLAIVSLGDAEQIMFRRRYHH